jgi:hypothetical protein
MPRVFNACFTTTYTFKVPTNIFLLDQDDIKNDGVQVGSWWIRQGLFRYIDKDGTTQEIDYDVSEEEKRPENVEEDDPESDDEEEVDAEVKPPTKTKDERMAEMEANLRVAFGETNTTLYPSIDKETTKEAPLDTNAIKKIACEAWKQSYDGDGEAVVVKIEGNPNDVSNLLDEYADKVNQRDDNFDWTCRVSPVDAISCMFSFRVEERDEQEPCFDFLEEDEE